MIVGIYTKQLLLIGAFLSTYCNYVVSASNNDIAAICKDIRASSLQTQKTLSSLSGQRFSSVDFNKSLADETFGRPFVEELQSTLQEHALRVKDLQEHAGGDAACSAASSFRLSRVSSMRDVQQVERPEYAILKSISDQADDAMSMADRIVQLHVSQVQQKGCFCSKHRLEAARIPEKDNTSLLIALMRQRTSAERLDFLVWFVGIKIQFDRYLKLT